MSANVFGGRFISHRIPAWHNLGTIFTDPVTASEGLKAANMDYEVTKDPAIAIRHTLFGDQIVEMPNRFILIREQTADDPVLRPFGIVSGDYTVVQNRELTAMLDPLTAEWPVETMGALGYGETTFFTMAAGTGEVAGDEIKQYFLVTDTKDGGHSLTIAFTPVRVVCQNTLTAGLKASKVNVQLPHNGRLDLDLAWRVDLLAKMQKAKDLTLAAFERLAKVVLSKSEIEDALAATYPAPRKPKKLEIADGLDLTGYEDLAEHLEGIGKSYAYYSSNAVSHRIQVLNLLDQFNDEFPATANTGWALVNSVVDHEDFRVGPASLFESAVFGERSRTKAKAMAFVSELCDYKLEKESKPKVGRPRKQA